ncbi:preprotein translocase subunit SecG [Alphaproteobacteria bacterium]|nr:preprotein translocase subunit SecG [Alphaproteobacteria bacterium]
MQSFLLAVHFILAISIIGLILLQKHDSDGALGSSGGGVAGGGMFSVRGQANLLTRATAVLMTIFMLNCLVLAKLYKHQKQTGSIVDRIVEDPNDSVANDSDSKSKKNPQPDTANNLGDTAESNSADALPVNNNPNNTKAFTDAQPTDNNQNGAATQPANTPRKNKGKRRRQRRNKSVQER